MIKLPADFKAKLVGALRSGEYQQSTGALYREGAGYCCLGVWYEVAGGEWSPTSISSRYATNTGNSCELSARSVSPEQWQVLEQVTVKGSANTIQGYLMQMNDSLGYTFDEIADWIDENL